MNEQIWWYVARSGGIVAVVLAGGSVIWGLFLTSRLLEGRPSPKWLLDMHWFLGGATVIFTLIHVAGLMLDSYVHFSLSDVLVPMAASWKPGAVAWGVVAFWLLLAVEITSLLMRRIPRRVWRFIHMGSYLMAWLGVVHGAQAGTDAGNPLYITVVAMMTLAIFYLTVFRVLAVRRRTSRSRRTSTMAGEPTAVPAGAR